MYRQGDVLLRIVESIKGTPAGKNRRVLALGEVTGHKHVLQGDVEFFTDNGLVLCNVGQRGAELVHEEHAQINVPMGKYQVVLQREYDLLEGVRQVID